MHNFFLQIQIEFSQFKFGILAFVTAFVVAMIVMPPLIRLIYKLKLFDVPDKRKEHITPIPTMGGIASCIGMIIACLIWFRFTSDTFVITFFFSMLALIIIGVMDDIKNLPARYKLALQLAVAFMIAFSGVRLTSFNGLFGIYELPLAAQYSCTILAIAGITNAFNLIDGIDGLAGGLGFMSLVFLGLFLSLSGDANIGVVAFALGGAILGFLYYNFNPAKIFMGDTGSLLLGFVISVLCIRLIQLNTGIAEPIVPHVPVFTLSIVAIPVFDTLRVFAIRIWTGKSPFSPDKNHVHHVLTNNGWSHSFTAKIICGLHGLVLVIGYFIKYLPQMAGLGVIFLMMLFSVFVFQKLRYQRPRAI